MADEPVNPLLSTHKAADSGLRILLHPLVLLTISDYITRHTLRRHEGPIVGALLGQQNGREISLENAFECLLLPGEGGDVILHDVWFKERLQQYKDVHKSPALDLVGWFTIAPTSGPQPQHIPIHRHIVHHYNESAVFLTFHPSMVLEGGTVGGKLPLSIYESLYERDSSTAQAGEDGDKPMQVDGEEGPLNLRFRELPYSVETGEAEMISVDFVARGGGNATAVDGTTKKSGKGQASQAPVGNGKGKEPEPKKEVNGVDDSSILSPEDEELIASLTARANAVRMLHSRIQLLRSYLSSLSSSYGTRIPPSEPTPEPTSETAPQPHLKVNHVILRSIQALINRLPLLVPADRAAFEQQALAEKNDVSLVNMLASLTRGVKDARELGRKFGIVDQARLSVKKSAVGDDFFAGMSENAAQRRGIGEEGYALR
ncbi:MAG: cop9 signalosome subunit 6 [Lasallia pustulata]|uniref:COP9 signalosome complex subunit 6 n=1 Tax=Lasallia pustulata TaxID=136370 RepID=A0A5M8PR39_9LECA|nr:MAG: cop9 signalosome subunit 6 [Lasallia pustulata]